MIISKYEKKLMLPLILASKFLLLFKFFLYGDAAATLRTTTCKEVSTCFRSTASQKPVLTKTPTPFEFT